MQKNKSMWNVNAAERRSKMDNKCYENKNLVNKKGAAKHCSWGLCNMDSRYPDRMKEGIFFVTFAKLYRLKTQWVTGKDNRILKRRKMQRDAFLPVERKILITLNK